MNKCMCRHAEFDSKATCDYSGLTTPSSDSENTTVHTHRENKPSGEGALAVLPLLKGSGFIEKSTNCVSASCCHN